MGLDSFPKGGSSLDSESSCRTLDATISYYGKERQFFDTRGERNRSYQRNQEGGRRSYSDPCIIQTNSG
ncbi:unnamed protein product [Spirodela intermedia]|uniref:Uncharacterized protein n=1 Tax=Spirodela intermedia TaxID=51605 RepID=A0A7I8KYQ4_SPIIN|nr:unnamed protein product [Spirodela intermedia]